MLRKFCLIIFSLPVVVAAADLSTSQTFSDGDTVNAAKLNNIIGQASINGSAIDGKSSASPISTDEILFYQLSSSALKKATVSSLLSGSFASPTFTGNVINSGSEAWTGIISPAQITGDQNNYAPAGFSSATTLRLSTDASRNITGLAGGTSGLLIVIHNVGSFNIVLNSQNGSSTAANRFALAHDITIPPDGMVFLNYDNTTQRWRTTGNHYHKVSDITDLALNPAFTTLTDAATITSTCSTVSPDQLWTVTLGGNRTLATPTGLTAGMRGILIVKQDAGGSKTITLWAGSKVVSGGGGALTLSTAANAIDILSWVYDGTNTFWQISKNFT
jgi:hypothetical protein